MVCKLIKIIQEFDSYGGGSESDEDDACYELEAMSKLLLRELEGFIV